MRGTKLARERQLGKKERRQIVPCWSGRGGMDLAQSGDMAAWDGGGTFVGRGLIVRWDYWICA